MRQGPAKMEFSYSVDGENRGSAESVDFRDLQMENLRLDEDDTDDNDDKDDDMMLLPTNIEH
jgi:hypothetical protein